MNGAYVSCRVCSGVLQLSCAGSAGRGTIEELGGIIVREAGIRLKDPRGFVAVFHGVRRGRWAFCAGAALDDTRGFVGIGQRIDDASCLFLVVEVVARICSRVGARPPYAGKRSHLAVASVHVAVEGLASESLRLYLAQGDGFVAEGELFVARSASLGIQLAKNGRMFVHCLPLRPSRGADQGVRFQLAFGILGSEVAQRKLMNPPIGFPRPPTRGQRRWSLAIGST